MPILLLLYSSGLKKQEKVTKGFSYSIICNLTTKPTLIFELVIEFKLNRLSYASDVTCQQLGHSECDKICDTDSYNRQMRESTNFQTKSL